MKPLPSLLLLAALAPASVHAGDPSAKAAAIEMPAAQSRWRFGASFAPLLNVESEFRGLGGFAAPAAAQPLGGMQNYEYEDGYVRVNSANNPFDSTSYWGYNNAPQYDAVGNTVSFNLTSSLSTGRAGETEDYSPGFEVFGYLEMGKVAELGGRAVNWGFKGGLHYAKISTGGSNTLTSDILRVTDSFDTTGIFLFPPPGYNGTFAGGGVSIGDDPTRTTTVIAGGATIQGERDLDVDMVTLAVGPYLEIPLGNKFSVSAEAGVSLSIARGEYEFDSLTTIGTLTPQTADGRETRTVLLPGAYAGLSAVWQLTESVGIHGSARYQYIDQFSVEASGSEASLSFDGAAVVSLGVVWGF